jgi:uncharacterized protein YggU (UPF0235/DUF167 family)
MAVVIHIKAKPNSKTESIRFQTNPWEIKVRAQAIEGLANESICRFIAEVFQLPPTRVSLQKGAGSKFKTIVLEIEAQLFHQKLEQLLQVGIVKR